MPPLSASTPGLRPLRRTLQLPLHLQQVQLTTFRQLRCSPHPTKTAMQQRQRLTTLSPMALLLWTRMSQLQCPIVLQAHQVPIEVPNGYTQRFNAFIITQTKFPAQGFSLLWDLTSLMTPPACNKVSALCR